MLTPILRLVMIYVLLALVVVGVFNRDKLIRLVTGQGGAPVAEAPATPAPVAAPAPEPSAAPAETTVQERAPAAPSYAPSEAPAQPQAQEQTPAPTQPTAPGQAVPLQTPVAPGTAPAAAPAQPGNAPAAPGAVAQAQPAAPALPDAELSQAINAARQAYWSGDRDGARGQLEALAAAHPDNPDLVGELGNFHFSAGDYPSAAQAYEQAGTLLVQQGRGGQAMALLPVLQRLDPARAEALAEVLGLR